MSTSSIAEPQRWCTSEPRPAFAKATVGRPEGSGLNVHQIFNASKPQARVVRSRLNGLCFAGVAIVLGAIVLAGCNNAGGLQLAPNELVCAPLGSISVFQLAGRLDLEVGESGRMSATLRDAANVVMIFCDPGGRAYVNGRAVGPSGGVTPVGEMLFVPEMFEAEIRLAMRVPKAEPTPEPIPPEPFRHWHVVLDPGHGGRDSGAISIAGYYEKTVNLLVAAMVAAELRSRGAKVTLTRRDDTFVGLNERAGVANRAGGDLFVSIHADSAHNHVAHGFTVYVARSASNASLAAGRCICDRLAATGAHNRGVRRANFRVLVRTSCPAVLVEMGYLSNTYEAARLARPGYQNRLAQSVADGIVDFLQNR